MSDARQVQDAALVQRVQSGDEAAAAQLMQQVEPSLRRFIGGRIQGRSDIELEDVLQDVRIYLHRRLDRYNPAYPLEVFARALAANVVKRYVFKRSDLVRGDKDDEGEMELSPQELERLPLTFRDVLGAERFEEPGHEVQPSRLFLETLEIFAREGGYPHQQVSFGFSILVWGRAKRAQRDASFAKVPVTGDPGRVVEEVGPQELGSAGETLFDEVREGAQLDPVYVERVRGPFDSCLTLKVKELFARDATSAKQFAALADVQTAATRLQQYFGRDARKSVSDWTRAVKLRVQRALQGRNVAEEGDE